MADDGMSFTKKELEESDLLVVVQADGSYKWASKRPAQEVADYLVTLGMDIMQKAEEDRG